MENNNWIPYTGDNLDLYTRRWLTVQETYQNEGRTIQGKPEVVFGHIDSANRLVAMGNTPHFDVFQGNWKVLAFQEKPEPFQPA